MTYGPTLARYIDLLSGYAYHSTEARVHLRTTIRPIQYRTRYVPTRSGVVSTRQSCSSIHNTSTRHQYRASRGSIRDVSIGQRVGDSGGGVGDSGEGVGDSGECVPAPRTPQHASQRRGRSPLSPVATYPISVPQNL
eukprot:1513372-Rhodomonas_salina.1